MRRIDRARVLVVLGVLVALAGRFASEQALSAAEDSFALFMGLGVAGWFTGLAILSLGVLASLWLCLTETGVVLRRQVRALAAPER